MLQRFRAKSTLLGRRWYRVETSLRPPVTRPPEPRRAPPPQQTAYGLLRKLPPLRDSAWGLISGTAARLRDSVLAQDVPHERSFERKPRDLDRDQQAWDEKERLEERRKRYQDAEPSHVALFQDLAKIALSIPGPWTFDAFLKFSKMRLKVAQDQNHLYQLALKLMKKDLFDDLKRPIKILEQLTPEERRRTSPSLFTYTDRLLLAEAAEVDPKDVSDMFVTFEQQRLLRKTLFRLIQLKSPLPPSFADYILLASYTDQDHEGLNVPPRFADYYRQTGHLRQLYRARSTPAGVTLREQESVQKQFQSRHSKGYDRWRQQPPLGDPYFARRALYRAQQRGRQRSQRRSQKRVAGKSRAHGKAAKGRR